MKKFLALAGIMSAFTLSACSSVERETSSSPVNLGQVNNVQMYAQDVAKLSDKWAEPEFKNRFNDLMDTPIKGITGTPAQAVLATPGLEEFFNDYAGFTNYSPDFERNLFACHVDNTPDNVETCINDLYDSMYNNHK